MYELLGYNRKRGEYEGNAYDNYYLHCRKVVAPEDHKGEYLEIFKVKAVLVSESELIIGGTYRFYYDRYGKVSEVQASI
jgi:hypothetical protein